MNSCCWVITTIRTTTKWNCSMFLIYFNFIPLQDNSVCVKYQILAYLSRTAITVALILKIRVLLSQYNSETTYISVAVILKILVPKRGQLYIRIQRKHQKIVKVSTQRIWILKYFFLFTVFVYGYIVLVPIISKKKNNNK